MRIDLVTLFPEMFTGVFGTSILKRAAEHHWAGGGARHIGRALYEFSRLLD